MSYANRLQLLLTALRPNREDAQAAEQFQAIKGRLAAATPGPWEHVVNGADCQFKDRVVAPCGCCGHIAGDISGWDAQFFAHTACRGSAYQRSGRPAEDVTFLVARHRGHGAGGNGPAG